MKNVYFSTHNVNNIRTTGRIFQKIYPNKNKLHFFQSKTKKNSVFINKKQ